MTTVLTPSPADRESPARRPRRSARISCADSLAPGVVERLRPHLGVTQSPKMSTASCVPGSAVRERNVGERDARADRVAVAAARHAADDLAACSAHRLRAERDRARIVEHEADELLRAARVERVPADEVALVALDGERRARPRTASSRRSGRSPTRGSPSRAAARRSRGSRPDVTPPRGDERVPELQPVLRRAVELPAELADIRDARRDHGDVADGELARRSCTGSRAASSSTAAAPRAPAAPRGRGTRTRT